MSSWMRACGWPRTAYRLEPTCPIPPSSCMHFCTSRTVRDICTLAVVSAASSKISSAALRVSRQRLRVELRCAASPTKW
eukprot:5382661-Alexandrium_andersonii.AAC.1